MPTYPITPVYPVFRFIIYSITLLVELITSREPNLIGSPVIKILMDSAGSLQAPTQLPSIWIAPALSSDSYLEEPGKGQRLARTPFP